MPARILASDEHEEAAKILLEGGLVAFPTDTVYGIAALADPNFDNHELRAFKGGRPGPFSLHFSDPTAASRTVEPQGVVESSALMLTVHGVTVIIADARTGKGIGCRVVTHEVGSRFLQAVAKPVVATSANERGQQPLNDPAAIAALPGIHAVIDGGVLPERPASTVVRLLPSGLEILREGALVRRDLERKFTKTIEFVCLGNLNRSAFAHRYAETIQAWWTQRIPGAVRAFDIRSSGLIANSRSRSPKPMQRAAMEYGVNLSSHVPARFDPARCGEAMHAIPMGNDVFEEVRLANPRVISWGILDPMGGPPEDYETTARQVHDAWWPMLARLAHIRGEDAALEQEFLKVFSGQENA